MSRKVFHNYKTLTENQKISLNCQYCSPEGSFGIHSETVGPLQLKAAGDSQTNEYIIDNVDSWDPGQYDCCISQKLLFDTSALQGLFQNDGVTTKDSTLGIAALWQIDKTGIRGCIDSGCAISLQTLRQCDRTTEVTYTQKFPAGLLAGTLQIHFILYLKELGLRTAYGKASLAGTLLGELMNPLIIHINGDAPAFPVVTVSSPGRELWWLEFGTDIDPRSDSFTEDFVAIVLNEAHADYGRLKNGEKYDTPLFREVLASALEGIFRYFYLDQFSNEMTMEEDFQEGSISMALKYMKDCFAIDTDTVENLHKSVRSMIRNSAGKGVAL